MSRLAPAQQQRSQHAPRHMQPLLPGAGSAGAASAGSKGEQASSRGGSKRRTKGGRARTHHVAARRLLHVGEHGVVAHAFGIVVEALQGQAWRAV